MMSRSIDALRKTYARFQHECFIACGFAILGAIYLLSINRNILYLGFLGAAYLIGATLFTRLRTMLASLAVLAVLAAVPANIPKAVFVKPSEGRQFINGNYYDTPKPSETWLYKFQVDGLETYQRECGGTLQGSLILDGLNLNGFTIKAGGNISSATISPLLVMKMEQLLIPLKENTSGEFIVSLQRKSEMPALIYVGPEARGFEIYGDAVWLEFKNEQCSVLYHAQRQTQK